MPGMCGGTVKARHDPGSAAATPHRAGASDNTMTAVSPRTGRPGILQPARLAGAYLPRPASQAQRDTGTWLHAELRIAFSRETNPSFASLRLGCSFSPLLGIFFLLQHDKLNIVVCLRRIPNESY